MSTYFETYYPNGNLEVQLSDKYLGFCITRSGTVTANFSQGEIYGLELSPTESFVMARTNNDILIVSPAYKLSNGNSVVYLGTRNGSAVQYKVVSLSKNVAQNQHNTGIEIFNEQGELIFANTMSLPQFEAGYIANYTYLYTDDRGYTFARNDKTRWQSVTVDDSSNKYIYSMQAPFGVSQAYDNGWSGNSIRKPWIYAGGYQFANNKISNLTSAITPSNGRITRILGGGESKHFGVLYYTDEESEIDYFCGLWCGMYQFATMLV